MSKSGKARAWLRERARGTQQTGVLVTKVSARFKPLALHVLPQGDQNAVHWFLEDKRDVRSSNYLEDAATEIQVQGLELDYACVLWDADMQADTDRWTFWKFNGCTAWTHENNADNRKYMLNAYRVLLTRARQGMVICIPEGTPPHSRRPPRRPHPPPGLLRFHLPLPQKYHQCKRNINLPPTKYKVRLLLVVFCSEGIRAGGGGGW